VNIISPTLKEAATAKIFFDVSCNTKKSGEVGILSFFVGNEFVVQQLQ
jgi:hypothetical protein